jgi:hypothetical protein
MAIESMLLRVPVAIKAKVTEDLKLKIIADLENTVKEMKLDIEQFDFQAKQVMNQAANDLQSLPDVRRQIDFERKKRTDALQETEDKLERARNLELGQEVGHGSLERTVEVKIGTNLETLMGAEILTEDGKVIAFRE